MRLCIVGVTTASLDHLPVSSGAMEQTASSIGIIKPRYSRTQKRGYMSNGCYDCDALIGEFFEHDAWHDEEATLAEFQIPISERWVKAIETTTGYDTNIYGWSVFAFE